MSSPVAGLSISPGNLSPISASIDKTATKTNKIGTKTILLIAAVLVAFGAVGLTFGIGSLIGAHSFGFIHLDLVGKIGVTATGGILEICGLACAIAASRFSKSQKADSPPPPELASSVTSDGSPTPSASPSTPQYQPDTPCSSFYYRRPSLECTSETRAIHKTIREYQEKQAALYTRKPTQPQSYLANLERQKNRAEAARLVKIMTELQTNIECFKAELEKLEQPPPEDSSKARPLSAIFDEADEADEALQQLERTIPSEIKDLTAKRNVAQATGDRLIEEFKRRSNLTGPASAEHPLLKEARTHLEEAEALNKEIIAHKVRLDEASELVSALERQEEEAFQPRRSLMTKISAAQTSFKKVESQYMTLRLKI
jgi:hypothetical protein